MAPDPGWPNRTCLHAGRILSRRTREFGIRVTLGASRRDIMRLVFFSSSKPFIAGILGGLLLAGVRTVPLKRALQCAPIPLATGDPVLYLVLCMLMAIAAFRAMVGHARRAARVKAVVALREE